MFTVREIENQFGAFEGEQLVGTMLYSLDGDAITVEINVPPANRRRGVGMALWDYARSRAAADNRNTFRTTLDSPFATKLGFTAKDNSYYELTVPTPLLRPAARGVILDPEDRILLIRFELENRTVWATPGGGVELGESVQDCLTRELREEVGLEAPPDPPHLWHRVTLNNFITGYDGAVNDYFLVRTENFTPTGTFTTEQLQAENIHGHHWWTPKEIQAHTGPDLLSPRALPHLLAQLLQDGPPATPRFLGGL